MVVVGCQRRHPDLYICLDRHGEAGTALVVGDEVSVLYALNVMCFSCGTECREEYCS
jgi:hypothetical protein